MNIVKQRFIFLISFLLVLMGMTSAVAQDFRFGTRNNKLGNADQFGYVRIVRELGQLPVGNQVLSLALVFSSDPKIEPSMFGPGWHFPLFSSTVYPSRQGVLVWEAPDEYRRFFVRDADVDLRSGEKAYKHQAAEWRAITNERRGTVRIEGLDGPHAYFEYRNGRLVSFQLGGGSEVVSVNYTARGYPRSLTVGARDILLKIDYSGATPERIEIMGKSIEIELGDGDWTAPDGKSDYQDYRVKYLTSLSFPGEKAESYVYSKGKRKERTMQIPSKDDPETFLTQNTTVPVNQLTLMDTNGTESWVNYEAQSGFIAADSGGEYQIRNDAYDPHIADKSSKGKISPDAVNIQRLPMDGTPKQFWSRDWSKGIETFTDSFGNVYRRTWIIAEGPAYGNLRRVEEMPLDAKSWMLLSHYSYNEKGRLVREIDGKTKEVVRFYYAADGISEKALIGNSLYYSKERDSKNFIVETFHYGSGSVEQRVYDPLRHTLVEEIRTDNDNIRRTVYDGHGKKLFVEHNGNVVEKYAYDNGYVYKKYPESKTFIKIKEGDFNPNDIESIEKVLETSIYKSNE